MRLHQGYAATPGLSTPTRTGDPARVAPMRGAALRACIIRGAEPYRPNQRRSARHPYRSRTVVARCAALILRAPLLIRLRFAADPSGWRPRYHPLRFARIIRCAPRRAARDTRTASITPVPARRPELRIRRDIQRANACTASITPVPSETAQNAPEATRNPERARTSPEALPRARRPLARVVARVPTGVPDRTAFRAGASRQTAPRTHQKPPETRTAPEAGQTPARGIRSEAKPDQKRRAQDQCGAQRRE